MMTMQGKICLITGGTNGIGKSTAQGLARMGATVVIVGRRCSEDQPGCRRNPIGNWQPKRGLAVSGFVVAAGSPPPGQ